MSHWSSEYVLTKSAKVIGAFCCAGRGLSTKTRDKRNIPKQCVWLMAISILISSAHVVADSTLHFNIPRQNADEALLQFGTQADISVVYDHNLIKDLRTNQLHGEFTLEQGIRILLKDSGLKAEFKSSSHLVVTRNYWGIDQMNSKKNLLAATVAFFMGSGAVNSVVAQDDVNAKPKGNYSIEEIVVTATKRAQSLQDTALSISALSSGDIDKRNLVGMEDYLPSVPGVSLQDRGAGQNTITMRGIGTGSQTETNPTVGVYLGETPVSGLAGNGNANQGGSSDIKLVDIERIEVLRGPQGTLYGAGSMGGTLRAIPAAPNLEEMEGKLMTRVSQTGEEGGNNSMIQGVLSVPLIEDELAIRAVAYRFDNSGYIDNVAASQPDAQPTVADSIAAGILAIDEGDRGSDEYTGYRLTALWHPSEQLDITLSHNYQKIEQVGLREVDINTAGDFQQARLTISPNGDGEGLENETNITNLVVDYDLGWGSILSSTSIIDHSSNNAFDIASFLGTNLGATVGESQVDVVVEELRFVSQFDGPFQILAGYYYEDREYETGGHIRWSGPQPEPASAFEFLSERVEEIKQQALFAELTYNLTDQLIATGGFRYFDYDQTIIRSRFNHVINNTEGLGGSVDDINYKFNLSYHLNEDTLVYGQWSEGFRLGRFQASTDIDDPDGDGLIEFSDGVVRQVSEGILDPDTVENIELGIKTSLLDNRLTLNAAIFRINWEGIPITFTSAANAVGYIFNAGEAKSEGVELEIQAQLTDGLHMQMGASYVEAVLTEDADSLGDKGDNLPGSADLNFNAALEYQFDLGEYESFARIDYTYVDEYHHLFTEVGPGSGDYSLVHLKVGTQVNNVNVDLFVNNLTNADEFTWRDNFFNAGRGYRLRPRTVGLNVGYQF